jgi:hypothetical protein
MYEAPSGLLYMDVRLGEFQSPDSGWEQKPRITRFLLSSLKSRGILLT